MGRADAVDLSAQVDALRAEVAALRRRLDARDERDRERGRALALSAGVEADGPSGPLEAPQGAAAPPSARGEAHGAGAPARPLPVAWAVPLATLPGVDYLTRAAVALIVAPTLERAGLPEPHVEVVDGAVVLTWQSDTATATATVLAEGTRVRLWCDDGAETWSEMGPTHDADAGPPQRWLRVARVAAQGVTA